MLSEIAVASLSTHYRFDISFYALDLLFSGNLAGPSIVVDCILATDSFHVLPTGGKSSQLPKLQVWHQV